MDQIEFVFIGRDDTRYPMHADARILEVMKTCIDNTEQCESESPGPGFRCRMQAGHKGVHVGGIVPVSDWQAAIGEIWK